MNGEGVCKKVSTSICGIYIEEEENEEGMKTERFDSEKSVDCWCGGGCKLWSDK